MFKRILVATDNTPQSNHAVHAAAALAKGLGAALTVFHASRTYKSPYYPDDVGFSWPAEEQYSKESSTNAYKLLTRASALAKKQGVRVATEHVFSDSPAEAIIVAAKKAKADLIVMASHGRKGLDRLLLGSETQKVLARTKLPVLIVR